MNSPLLLPLCSALLSVIAAAQSGRKTLLTAPVVLGQTAGFALRHTPTIAGNGYALLLSAPSWPLAVPVTVPGVVVNGLLRLDANGLLVGAAGVLGASGQTATLPMPIPNNPLLVGFSFDVQGVDVDGAGVFTLTSNDLEIVVAAPPLLTSNMVPIAAGTFSMGSTLLGVAEGPVHSVTITRPFWMGRFEVTQAEWQAVMGSNPSYWLGANLPVEQVTWTDAVAYCDALSVQEAAAGRLPSGYEYRLPTEAEWEFCCRAGTTTEWNVGTSIGCGQAAFAGPQGGCGLSQTVTVGSYAANPWGLNDMHGNVWEWCHDSWSGNPNYPGGPVSDPYVTSGAYRVSRGGSWGLNATYCRSARRFGGPPAYMYGHLGLRVVCAPAIQ